MIQLKAEQGERMETFKLGDDIFARDEGEWQRTVVQGGKHELGQIVTISIPRHIFVQRKLAN